MQIRMLDNEYWWGGVVDLGDQMPYDAQSECEIVLGQVGEDQSSPLYLSSKGRYLWSSKPFRISFHAGTITIDSDYAVELGEGFGTLKGAHKVAAKKFFGKSRRIPDTRFFRVPQYNTWIELMYDQNQKQILEYARSIVDMGMTPGILMIDEGWSEDYGVFDFYPGRFSDPKDMVRQLQDMGFTVMLWVTPHISPDSNAFRELRDTDFLIRDKDGEFAIRKWWNGYSCVLDLSNPEARHWLQEKLRYVAEEYHVDGFKFDAGDPYMYRDEDQTYVCQLGLDNTSDYSRFAADYTFNELRAVWNMGGEPLVCRLHDKLHRWDHDGLNCIIPNTILQGLLGYYYGCPDMVGGGNYGSFIENGFHLDEELYIRWLEASLLCPMLQFSIAPWRVLSGENYETVKKLLRFRSQYADYFVQLAKNAAENHDPIVRHMEYEFPGCGYERENSMYMLGDRYLVIPMVEQGKTERTVKLPNGRWRDLDGNEYSGGAERTLECPLDRVHIFEKESDQ